MKYLLDFNGVSEVTDEFYASIPSSAFTDNLDGLKEGKTLVMSDDQIKFYNLHKDYDYIHIFNMNEYNENEIEEIKNKENGIIENIRQIKYKKYADPLYMGYVKNMALGQDEKASEYYNRWIETINSIKEENPYIE